MCGVSVRRRGRAYPGSWRCLFLETQYWLFSLGFSVRFPHNFCSADSSDLFAQGFVLFCFNCELCHTHRGYCGHRYSHHSGTEMETYHTLAFPCAPSRRLLPLPPEPTLPADFCVNGSLLSFLSTMRVPLKTYGLILFLTFISMQSYCYEVICDVFLVLNFMFLRFLHVIEGSHV